MSNLDYKEFYRRNLPHIQPKDAIIFITYRIKFNLPMKIKKKLQVKNKLIRDEFKISSKEKRKDIENEILKMQFEYFDDFLGTYSDYNNVILDGDFAEIISKSLHYLDKKKIKLYSYCIMPNHVHLLIKPLKKKDKTSYSLSEIMKLHKGFTANKINQINGESGQFWHHENYDHYIRNEEEFYNIIWYILNNPIKAGLCRNIRDWQYSWICDELKEDVGM